MNEPTPIAPTPLPGIRPMREKFSCSGDQFDVIVAFAERHGLLHAPFHLVVSAYKRTRLH